MRRLAFAVAGFLIVADFAATAQAGRTVPTSVRKQIARRFDADGDGKLNIVERGAARLAVGAARQNGALLRNEKAVKKAR